MKYYIRDGRRFVKIQSAVGMYYNTDGSFTSIQTSESIGVCIVDDFEKIVIASIHHLERPMNWFDAKAACENLGDTNHIWYLPSLTEVMIATKIEGARSIFNWVYSTLWTSTQYNANFAYYWASSLYITYKTNSYVVVPFLTLYK